MYQDNFYHYKHFLRNATICFMKQFQVNEWNLLETSNVIALFMDILILDSLIFFWPVTSLRWKNLGPKLHPGGWFFGPWFFIILQNSHQDEGSNFILSSLKVDHTVAQTYPFFDKLPWILDFGLLQKSQNRERFWIC